MNTTLVTTGLIPLTVGSIETFYLRAFLAGLPWDLTGGIVRLLMSDPNGVTYTYACTIAGGAPHLTWTVLPFAGTWTRAWSCTDADGVKQISRPIVFTVENSP